MARIPLLLLLAASSTWAAVDLNTAPTEEIATLPGVDAELAQRIVDWREARGPYESVEDLFLIPGIGPAIVYGLHDHVVFGRVATDPGCPEPPPCPPAPECPVCPPPVVCPEPPPCPPGPDLRTTLVWHNVIAVDLVQQGKAEDVLQTLSLLQAEARWKTARGGRVVLGVSAEHVLRHGRDTEAEWAVWPDSAYLDEELGPVRLRVGQQVARWGKLETVSLVDVLNPRDLRHGPLQPDDALRVASPMVRAEVGQPSLRGQLFLLPFHVPARYDALGTDWAIFPPGVVDNLVAGSAGWGGDPETAALIGPILASVGDQLDSAEPSTWWALDEAARTTGRIDGPLDGVELAGRLAWSLRGADGSVMVARVREDLPVVSVAPRLMSWSLDKSWPSLQTLMAFLDSGNDPVTVKYQPTWMAGLDAATTLGPLGLRAEGAAWSHRGLTTRKLAATTSPEVGVGAGVDWSPGGHLQLTVEGSWRYLLDMDGRLLARRDHEVFVGGRAELSVLQERLDVEVAALVDVMRGEVATTAEASWRPRDAWALTAGVILFESPYDVPRTLSRLSRYPGGTIGLYDDNDAVTAGVVFYL